MGIDYEGKYLNQSTVLIIDKKLATCELNRLYSNLTSLV